MPKTYQVKIKPKCRHGRKHADYDAKRPTGNPGPYALAGEIITVSHEEFIAFGDKFVELDPVTAVLAGNGTTDKSDAPEPELVIAHLRAQLESQQEAHEETARELNAARKALSITPPAPKRGRPKKAAPAKDA